MSGYSAKLIKLQKENKQLRKALETKYYCQYANKCNELYDCTREEYNSMAERNMKLSLENDELQQENKQQKEQLDKAISFIYLLKNNVRDYKTKYKEDFLNMLDDIGNILGDKENE